MFTGIIHGIGTVVDIRKLNNQLLLKIQPAFKLDDFQLGESVAINGCCLTVFKATKLYFEVYVSNETRMQTNLKNLKIKSFLNIERALKFNERIGGHIVTGHIDEVAPIKSIQAAGESKIITLTISKKNSNFLIERGSIAIDGISLTIINCDKQLCKMNLIPETINTTTANFWRQGYVVNIEFDALIKSTSNVIKQLNISKNFLCEYGFL